MTIQGVWLTDKEKLLKRFSTLVEERKYSKMPYKEWRKLNSIDSNCLSVKYCYGNIDTGEKTYYTVENLDFCFDDKSFGEFLHMHYLNDELSYYSFTNNNDNFIITCTVDNNNNKNISKKETKEMNMFNFDFGPVPGQRFRMSPYGLAVNTSNNGWIAYNSKTGELINVDIVNFDISKMIYKMPVAESAIAAGDILMHGGKPVFVRNVNTNGTVEVIDYANASVSNILPVKSPFGFNFYTKVCSLFNFDANTTANADNPFGNMLPFLMLSGEEDGDFDPTMLMIASMMTNGNIDFSKNPMMMYFLMNRKDRNDMLPFFFMMNGSSKQ